MRDAKTYVQCVVRRSTAEGAQVMVTWLPKISELRPGASVSLIDNLTKRKTAGWTIESVGGFALGADFVKGLAHAAGKASKRTDIATGSVRGLDYETA